MNTKLDELELLTKPFLIFINFHLNEIIKKFKDKPGGLIVDYLGVADELKQALQDYTESGGKGRRGKGSPSRA